MRINTLEILDETFFCEKMPNLVNIEENFLVTNIKIFVKKIIKILNKIWTYIMVIVRKIEAKFKKPDEMFLIKLRDIDKVDSSKITEICTENGLYKKYAYNRLVVDIEKFKANEYYKHFIEIYDEFKGLQNPETRLTAYEKITLKSENFKNMISKSEFKKKENEMFFEDIKNKFFKKYYVWEPVDDSFPEPEKVYGKKFKELTDLILKLNLKDGDDIDKAISLAISDSLKNLADGVNKLSSIYIEFRKLKAEEYEEFKTKAMGFIDELYNKITENGEIIHRPFEY